MKDVSKELGAMTRRDLVKGAALAGAALAASVPAAAAAGEAGGLTAGTYTATAQGYMGDVTVCVTVSEDAILDVKVAGHTDMPDTVCGAALEQMPGRIVDAQSVMCDTVAGATMTSLGIRNAVIDCLAQAGDPDAFGEAPEPVQKAEAEPVSVDVLVIGGGASGIMSALNAKYRDFDGVDGGLSVMLVEKLAMTGGSVMISGGSCRTAVPLNDNSYVDDPEYIQPLFDYMQSRNSYPVNEPLLQNIYRVSGETMMKMERLGGPYVTKDAYNDIESYSGSVKINNRVTPPRPANHVYRTQVEKRWLHGGVQVQEFFQKWLPESGVDVRLNTKMLELVVEDGAVLGARVEGPESTYTVYAKKTIMATGGFARNADMIAQYAPAYEGVIPFIGAGATGEGFRALVDLGAKTIGDGVIAYLGTDIRYGMWPDMGTPYYQGYGNFMCVNKHGERFVRDGGNHDIYRLTEGIVAQDDKIAWAIIDSQNPDYELTDGSVMVDYKWKADSLEELAEMIGIPADSLVATAEAYNKAYDDGVEDEFGLKPENRLPLRTPPFYAVVLHPIAIGSLVGIDANENCQVLVDGEPVPNLYAVGELVFGGNLCTVYQGALSNATAFFTGRIAAMHAKAAISDEG